MYPLEDWPSESPKLYEKTGKELLFSNKESDNNLDYNALDELIEASNGFPVEFPIDTGRCKILKTTVSESVLLRNVNSAYPVLHEAVLPLFIDFILHKRKYGSKVEKELYKEMNFLEFIDRLLTKRAVMFMGRLDDYILLDGVKGRSKWETIGKDGEESPLILENCLSYDEIKLSAFLSVSSFSHFVNDGSRKNKGVVATNRSNLQEEGIIIGLIGARMKKKGYMEYQDIVIDPKQNTEANGFGLGITPSVPSVMSNFYGKTNMTYTDFLKSKDRTKPGYFTEISKGTYFDNMTFSKRIAISIDTLLFEANHRAKEKETSAFVHVVGIGLGVWKCSTHQEEVFMETFAKRIE
ncbi:protein of unknown function (DUF4804) [Popillia japonica]|uniref:Uncharacterized protein n=1 Tax=Popillia japonica TaxID=7064 RepID=A0AAW1MIF3_POPJA